jgi:CRP/FNR family transcriptional regulator, cyclic AMP receptor protein
MPKTSGLINSPNIPAELPREHILADLPRQYSSLLLQDAKSVLLPEGRTLFEKGDPGDGCYWVQRGVLKVIVASQRGEELILAVLGSGAIVGELAMLDDLPRSATVQAINESQLVLVSRAAFTKCLQDHPEIYAYLVSALVARLRQADEEAAAASFLTGKARIARALLNLAQHLGKGESPSRIEIPHKIRQGDIAAMAGVARESVSRTIGEWRRRNVITTKSRYLVVNTTTLQREVDAGD